MFNKYFILIGSFLCFGANISYSASPKKRSTSEASSVVHGMNIDPTSSLLFKFGSGYCAINPNIGTNYMRQGIYNKINLLDHLRETGLPTNGGGNAKADISIVKTFYAMFSDPTGQCQVNIADVVNDWNTNNPVKTPFKLALGVYEFKPEKDGCSQGTCMDWTAAQVDAAILSAKNYPNLIHSVVIGNEDFNDIIEPRITADAKKIKANAPNVKVGTAQMPGVIIDEVINPSKSAQHKDFLNAMDFIGVNIYPFWGQLQNTPVGSPLTPAKNNMKEVWSVIRNFQKNNRLLDHLDIIETEEGWPTTCYPNSNACYYYHPGTDEAHDYLYYWYFRTNTGDDSMFPKETYYFQLEDKDPILEPAVEGHWGIYSNDSGEPLTSPTQIDDSSVIPYPAQYPYTGKDSSQNSPSLHFSSIIGPNGETYDKALSKDHVRVTFQNNLQDKAYILACGKQFDGGTDPKCWPINGSMGSSEIQPHGDKKAFVINNSFQSLMIIYDSGASKAGLCYFNSPQFPDLATYPINWNSTFAGCK